MLFDIDPTIGRVGGSICTHAPVVNDRQIGRSKSIVPTIGRIDVDNSPKLVARMGGRQGNLLPTVSVVRF